MGVLRTWICQNKDCGKQFDSWNNYPRCPQCHCIRTTWLPAGGHLLGLARTADAALRDLADAYGMSDINTAARAGERAMPALKPALRQQPAAPGQMQQFAPGFVGPASTQAVCVPSAAHIDFKVKAPVGRPFGQSKALDPRHNTVFEGRTK
jgi:hypothetical protein